MNLFAEYTNSAKRMESRQRQQTLVDLNAAISGSFSGKGLKEHLNELKKESGDHGS